MKKMLLFVALVFSAGQLWSQAETTKSVEDRSFRIPLIGESAPSFNAKSTNGNISFPSQYGTAWKILFSHPADFTPVCTTEILELAYLQSEFEKLGVKVVVVSSDPLETHVQWKKSMESLNLNNRGPVSISFPIVDDENLDISKKYGMIHPLSNTTKSVRGVFIIDPANIVQAIYFYPLQVGRNTDELLRMVSALQTTSASKVLTPVNWRAGNDLLVPIPPQTDPNNSNAVPAGYYSPSWYLWYKKSNQ
jgi:peroxiredoxin (alkyl hydroperoxide reductase subunit C)